MRFHANAVSARISTIAHATEDAEKVSRAVRNLSLAWAHVDATTNRTRGHHGSEIVTLVFTVRKSKIVESVLQDIWKGLSELDKSEVYSSLDSRIDATGSLFLRIDKQEALKGKIRLQNTDPIKVEFSFRTKFSKAAEFVEDIRRSLDAI